MDLKIYTDTAGQPLLFQHAIRLEVQSINKDWQVVDIRPWCYDGLPEKETWVEVSVSVEIIDDWDNVLMQYQLLLEGLYLEESGWVNTNMTPIEQHTPTKKVKVYAWRPIGWAAELR